MIKNWTNNNNFIPFIYIIFIIINIITDFLFIYLFIFRIYFLHFFFFGFGFGFKFHFLINNDKKFLLKINPLLNFIIKKKGTFFMNYILFKNNEILLNS